MTISSLTRFLIDPLDRAKKAQGSLHSTPGIPQHVLDQIAQAEQAREALDAIKLRTLPTRA